MKWNFYFNERISDVNVLTFFFLFFFCWRIAYSCYTYQDIPQCIVSVMQAISYGAQYHMFSAHLQQLLLLNERCSSVATILQGP